MIPVNKRQKTLAVLMETLRKAARSKSGRIFTYEYKDVASAISTALTLHGLLIPQPSKHRFCTAHYVEQVLRDIDRTYKKPYNAPPSDPGIVGAELQATFTELCTLGFVDERTLDEFAESPPRAADGTPS